MYKFCLFCYIFLIAEKHCANLERQTEQIDKSVSILLIINFIFREGCEVFAVKRVGGLNAGYYAVALIKLEFNGTCAGLLR